MKVWDREVLNNCSWIASPNGNPALLSIAKVGEFERVDGTICIRGSKFSLHAKTQHCWGMTTERVMAGGTEVGDGGDGQAVSMAWKEIK